MSHPQDAQRLGYRIDSYIHAQHIGPTPPPLAYSETGRQVYAGNGATFSAGLLRNHPVDTLYLTLERDGEPFTLHLRRDEASIIIWLLSGAMWSEQVGQATDNGLSEEV